MTTTEQVIQGLSPEARSAMINAGSSRMGTRVLSHCTPAVFMELAEWGLIGPNDGLTRQGSIARAKIMDQELDKAFG